MEVPGQSSSSRRTFSRQLSAGSIGSSSNRRLRCSFQRNLSFDPKLINAVRFSFGRQSSLDPNRWRGKKGHADCRAEKEELKVPGNLDTTMQLLFLACQGDAKGVEELLKDGIDVNSIDLDGRTALHIAACEGNVDVVKLLLFWRANIDARDRWGSTAAADAKCYGNTEVYKILKARGAKTPKIKRTPPMAVEDPRQVPEYELNPAEIQFRRGEEILKDRYQVAKWNGIKVSVKVLDKDSCSDPQSIDAFKHELTLLEKVRHPNIIQFVGAVTQHFPMMIVSECYPKDDLASYIQKKGRLKPHKVLRFATEIARGMNYLHQCKPDTIIHCDLKPKNILLDIGGHLKVAGFGSIMVSQISPDKARLANYTQLENLSPYMAPEIYRNEIFEPSVDSFSFGLILYEMIEGAPAFHPKKPEEATKMICFEGKRPSLKHKCKSYPPDLKELIEECWDHEPVVRPIFSEILVRLSKIYITYAKQAQTKSTFKIPWLQ